MAKGKRARRPPEASGFPDVKEGALHAESPFLLGGLAFTASQHLCYNRNEAQQDRKALQNAPAATNQHQDVGQQEQNQRDHDNFLLDHSVPVVYNDGRDSSPAFRRGATHNFGYLRSQSWIVSISCSRNEPTAEIAATISSADALRSGAGFCVRLFRRRFPTA